MDFDDSKNLLCRDRSELTIYEKSGISQHSVG